MGWEDILKLDDSTVIDNVLNYHIFDRSNYNDKMAKYIEKKLKEFIRNAEVEYVEDDVSFYITVGNDTYRFDEKGNLTKR